MLFAAEPTQEFISYLLLICVVAAFLQGVLGRRDDDA